MKSRCAFWILVASTWLAASSSAKAEVVPTLPLTGQLTDAGGVPIEGPVQVLFSFFSTESGGTPIWSQAYDVTVTNGFVTVLIGADQGAVTPSPSERNDLLEPRLFNGPTYLEVRVESDPPMSPRIALGASAFAFRASVAETLECEGCISSEHLADVGCAAGEVLKWEGTRWQCAADDSGASSGGPATDVVCSGCVDSTDLAASAVQTTHLAQSGCSSGEILKWTGTAWACALDDVGGGGPATDLACSNCVSGGELADGAVSFNHLNSAGCNNGQVPKLQGGRWTCGNDNTGSQFEQTVSIPSVNVGNSPCDIVTGPCTVSCPSNHTPIACSYRRGSPGDVNSDDISCRPVPASNFCEFLRDSEGGPDLMTFYCTCLRTR